MYELINKFALLPPPSSPHTTLLPLESMSQVTTQPDCPRSTWLGLGAMIWGRNGIKKHCLGLRGPSVNSVLQASPFCLPQSVLKKRDQVQAEYEAKLEAVALRREDRPKVSEASGGGRGCSGPQAVTTILGPSQPCPYIRRLTGQCQLGCVDAVTSLSLPPFMSYFWKFLMCA